MQKIAHSSHKNGSVGLVVILLALLIVAVLTLKNLQKDPAAPIRLEDQPVEAIKSFKNEAQKIEKLQEPKPLPALEGAEQ